MKRLEIFICVIVTMLVGKAHSAAAETTTWNSHIFRIVALRTDGMREIGSAVALSDDRLVTNCHVLAGAARIEVESGDRILLAEVDQGDQYRDLCFLRAPGLAAAPIPTIDIGETRVGLSVVSAGYPGGKFTLSSGRIVGLHTCECDGGKVIQTSAPFDRGASGGGLFDTQGRLIGILTFKSRNGGNFHFALPIGWLRHIAELPAGRVTNRKSFWISAGKESGYFLSACSLEERKDWPALARLTEEWREREPHNPEAWMASGRAHRGLNRIGNASTDFQHVLMLDSTHAEAKWAMQDMEMLTGDPPESGKI
jgi:hypothetical protein